eukprot:1377508-Pyramimonas_sp.AAC.1
MCLFALALDPILRWLLHMGSAHIDRGLGYADDLLFGVCDIRTGLVPILELQGTLDNAIGLRLNYAKCQL